VSTSSDSPDGDTKSVAWPPSTSMNWMSSDFAAWAVPVRLAATGERGKQQQKGAHGAPV